MSSNKNPMFRKYMYQLIVGTLFQAADTYSFGVLLWEMYTGQRPWAGMLQMQIIFNVTVQKKQLEFPSDAPEQIKVCSEHSAQGPRLVAAGTRNMSRTCVCAHGSGRC